MTKHRRISEQDIDLQADFRPVAGTGGLYQVARDGTVISQRWYKIPPGCWQVLRGHIRGKHGALWYCLHYDNPPHRVRRSAGRLVLEAWSGPPPTEDHVAAHRDGDRENNHLSNLMWATREQVVHGQMCRGTKKHGEQYAHAKWTSDQIAAMREMLDIEGVTIALLARVLRRGEQLIWITLKKYWKGSEHWKTIVNPLLPD